MKHEHQYRKEKCIWCGLSEFAVQVLEENKTKPRIGRPRKKPVPKEKFHTKPSIDKIPDRIIFLKECLNRAVRLDLPLQARLYREELERIENHAKIQEEASSN